MIYNVRPLMLCALVSLSAGARAETAENFNSRKGVPIQDIKKDLQNACWSFHHFDVNSNNWNPGLEGDGAMVANADAPLFANSGIYTPVLSLTNTVSLSFEYTFSTTFKGEAAAWLNICLATENNDIVQVLDKLDFDGFTATHKMKYSTSFKNIFPGEYKLVLQYGGTGTTAQIAIDKLNISAPFKYPGGCNTSPVAVKDRITGMANRSASGSLLRNDKEANKETLTAYLIKNSPDGKVELNDNGGFIFTPNKTFKGSSTSFTYKICDNGAVNLCSENTTVYINFPDAPAKAINLSEFKGSYRMNGNVELVWKTQTLAGGEKFEVERSFDGRDWTTTGSALSNSLSNPRGYTFTDKLSRNKIQKNDLYYRLKQVNTDGSSVGSRLLVIRLYNTRTLTMISVTPNPAKNDIAVNVQLQQNAYVAMRVLNSAGSSEMYKIAEGGEGVNTFIIDGSSKLRPGVYTLEVIVNSKERMLVKLIKE